MRKFVLLLGLIFCVLGGFAQETLTYYPTKKIAFTKDTITIEKFSLNNSFFEIKDGLETFIGEGGLSLSGGAKEELLVLTRRNGFHFLKQIQHTFR